MFGFGALLAYMNRWYILLTREFVILEHVLQENSKYF
jgi:hypothetical protein